MVSFFGDYDTTETVIIPFNTFTSDDPSASATITNLIAGDVEIHKDGGVTQRASDNGVTVTIDFDSVTGNHIVSIDLSDNSDAGFYAAGSRYQVRIEGTTVDGGTVNAWIGAFSIGCTLRPTTAGRTLDVTATGAAGIDWANVEGKTTSNALTGTTIATTQKVDVETIKTQAVTCAAGVTVGVYVGGTGAAALETTAQTIVTDTADMQPKIGSITDLGGGATVGANLSDMAGATFSTTTDALEAIRNRGDAAWTTGAGTGLTALASGTAQSGTASTVVLASGEAFADNVLNGNVVKITSGTGAGQARVIISNTLADDTCNVAPNWITNPSSDSVYEIVQGSVNIEAISLDNTAANNLELDYDGTGFDKANSTIGTTTTNTDMRGTDSAALASVCTEGRLAELDAANLPADLDAVLTDTGTTLPATLATAQADLDIITGADGVNLLSATQASIDAIEADTNALQVDWANGGRLDVILDARAAEATLTDGSIVVGTINDGAIGAAAVADIFSTTTIAEAYAADAAAGTPAQILYQIQQALTEFAIASTTLTVKKLDGSTTAATYTLDSATVPTSRTRAT